MGRSRIGLFLRVDDNDFQQRIRDDAVATGARLGFDVSVLSAGNDAVTQRSQIEGLLKRDSPGLNEAALAAILVSPVSGGLLADLARVAAGAGIGWVVLNREAGYLTGLRDEYPAVPLFGVSPDHREIGRIQGQQVTKLLPQGGNVLYVSGHANTSSAALRLQGFRQEIHGRRLVVSLVDADWTFEGAQRACGRWLRGLGRAALPLGACCAQNDQMALGTRQALVEAAQSLGEPKLAEVPITGCDGSPDVGQRLVAEGRLRATVSLPSPAGPALELIERMKAENDFRPPLEVLLPVSSFPGIDALA